MGSNAEGRLFARYAAWGFGSVLLGFLLALATQLPGDAPINWRQVGLGTLQAVISVVTLLVGAINLPRQGSAQLAEEVDALRDRGIHRDEMRPVSRTAPVPRTAAEQILDAPDPPAFLPPNQHPGTHGEEKG